MREQKDRENGELDRAKANFKSKSGK